MSDDDDDNAMGAFASDPRVAWLFMRIGNTLKCKPDKLLSMKKDEVAGCVSHLEAERKASLGKDRDLWRFPGAGVGGVGAPLRAGRRQGRVRAGAAGWTARFFRRSGAAWGFGSWQLTRLVIAAALVVVQVEHPDFPGGRG